jgi:hypothetical protein
MSAFGQTPPIIYWQNTIGGNLDDEMTTIEQTADGGYICGGFSESAVTGDKTDPGNGLQDYWIMKLDAMGNIEWQNAIGGSGVDNLRDIKQTADGGYICGGESDSPLSGDKTENGLGDFDYWIVKLDSIGNIEWQNTIGGAGFDRVYEVEEAADGFICAGSSSSGISPDKSEGSYGLIDFWVVKLDNNGMIQWENTIGGNLSDGLFSIDLTTDGGFILGGFSWSDMGGDKTEPHIGNGDYWVIKIDAFGNIEWQNTIGGSGNDVVYGIKQYSDGGYICAGMSTSNISGDKNENSQGSNDYWVLRLDSVGDIVWQNNIGGLGVDWLYSMDLTADWGIIVGGHSASGISGDKTEPQVGGLDYWIIKLNGNGGIEWQKVYGGDQEDRFGEIMSTTDGGFILGGTSLSGISGDKTEASNGGQDYWILKLDSAFTTGSVDIQAPVVSIFPNPSAGIIHIERSGTTKATELSELIVSDLSGKILSRHRVVDRNEMELDLGHLPAGYYNLSLHFRDGRRETHKLILVDQ